MARLFADGFDMYAAASDSALGRWNVYSPTGGAPGLVSGAAPATPFGNGQALTLNACVNGYLQGLFETGTNETTIFASVRVKNTSNTLNTSVLSLVLMDGANYQCSVTWHGDGQITAHTGLNGAALATVNGAYSSATWDSYQIKAVINNTTGSLEVRKNGSTSPIIIVSGVNTRGGSTNNYANCFRIFENSSSIFGIDDVWLSSDNGANPVSWPGDVRCMAIPVASQTQAQFGLVGAATNWQAVANVTEDGDTSYVFSATVGQEDIYGVTAMGVTPASILGIAPFVMWRKTDAGARTATLSIAADGSADTPEIVGVTPSNTYVYAQKFMPLTPGGLPWTVAKINGLTIGLTLAS